jgi:hypothetical protein
MGEVFAQFYSLNGEAIGKAIGSVSSIYDEEALAAMGGKP